MRLGLRNELWRFLDGRPLPSAFFLVPSMGFPPGGVGTKNILTDLHVLVAGWRPTFASRFLKCYQDHYFYSQKPYTKHSPTTSPPSLGVEVVVVVFGVPSFTGFLTGSGVREYLPMHGGQISAIDGQI